MKVIRLGKHHMIDDLCYPAVVALFIRLLCALQNSRGAAHKIHITSRCGHRGQRIQIGGITIVPTKISLVDSFRIMADSAVVAPTGKCCL